MLSYRLMFHHRFPLQFLQNIAKSLQAFVDFIKQSDMHKMLWNNVEYV